MKLVSILITIITLTTCRGVKDKSSEISSNPVLPAKNENAGINESTMKQDNDMVIEYSAITRGSSLEIKMTKDTLVVKDSKGTNLNTKNRKETWDKVMTLLQDIDIRSLPELESPSRAFEYDAALAATLKITTNGQTYETMTFDHGKPNKKLESIVEVLMASAISH